MLNNKFTKLWPFDFCLDQCLTLMEFSCKFLSGYIIFGIKGANMNIKTFTKKLELKKKTIAHLDNVELRSLHGGAPGGNKTLRPTICPILSCDRTCTC